MADDDGPRPWKLVRRWLDVQLVGQGFGRHGILDELGFGMDVGNADANISSCRGRVDGAGS